MSAEIPTGGDPGTFPAVVVDRVERRSMANDTANPDLSGHDEGVSLSKVAIERLTDFEKTEIIPACDFVVVGYDSSYSDAETTTKRVDDPAHSSEVSPSYRVRGEIAGVEHDGDREIGISGSAIRTSKSSGRIGRIQWIAYPDDEPDKETYDVTLWCLAGKWSTARDDPDVDGLTESTVEKYDWANSVTPPVNKRKVEDVRIGPDKEQRRVLIGLRHRHVLPESKVDWNTLVDRTMSEHGGDFGGVPAAQFRDEIPPVGEHLVEVNKPGRNDKNLRKSVRFWVEDATVRRVD
jgi:hypothetical protein